MIGKNRFFTATVCLVVLAALFGVFLRFTHLDQKFPTHDEVFTALRVSGYTEAELVQDLSSNVRPVGIEYLQKYQTPNPQKTIWHTINGLAQEEPQLTPLYFVTVKLWAQLWGGAIGILRSWSALISVFGLPCIYWLSMELFKSRLTASLATVILAITPFYFMASQDARHYSLWTVSILLMSAALLQAMRIKNQVSWAIYAFSVAFSLYTGLLSIIIAFGHAIYVFSMERFRFQERFLSYVLASAVGIIAFIPWVAIVFFNWAQLQQMSGQTDTVKLSLAELARGWVRQPGKLLYDPNISADPSTVEKILQYSVTVGCLIFVLYTFYFLLQTTVQRVWLFIFTLVGTTAFGLVIQDLTLGGHAATGGMSNIPKYLTPCFLGIVLAIAHLFAYQLTEGSLKQWQRRIWIGVVAIFISTQLLNTLSLWQAQFTWLNGHKDEMQTNLAAFNIINETEKPLLLTDSSGWDIMYLSQYLNPNVKILTKPTCVSCSVQVDPKDFRPAEDVELSQFSRIFLFPHPSDAAITWAKQQAPFQIKEVSLMPTSETKLLSLELP